MCPFRGECRRCSIIRDLTRIRGSVWGPVLRASLSEVSVLYYLRMDPGRRQIELRSVRRLLMKPFKPEFFEPVSGPPNVNFEWGNAKKSVKKTASTPHPSCGLELIQTWSRLKFGPYLFFRQQYLAIRQVWKSAFSPSSPTKVGENTKSWRKWFWAPKALFEGG